MGRPFHSELEKINDTFQWAINQSVEPIVGEILDHKKKPLFIVGSGGSLSACHYLAGLYQAHGMMAKAITPLELFYSKSAIRESNVLFISASGKNTDILFGYRTAISFEPEKIFSLCMKKNSPLGKLAATVSISRHYEFNLPSGKDGFLATNSLIAFFAIFFKIFTKSKNIQEISLREDGAYAQEQIAFFERVSPEYTFTVLHAGWGQCVAVDLESKLAEAALGDVLVSDFRNFGHGRHHWFDKRKYNSAIIALITPLEEGLANKTLELLPKDIPILKIQTQYGDEFSSIDLLAKSFHFVNKLGQLQNIDPGRPGVPDFGSKLYHLNYKRFYEQKESEEVLRKKTAIIRKSRSANFESLSETDKTYWETAYNNFLQQLQSTAFGSLIFDYDGTICSSKNRFIGVDPEVVKYLNNFLSKGIIIGLATGRGKSVREKLQEVIEEKYWNQVIIGYYNCSDFGLLSENNLPNKELEQNRTLASIFEELTKHKFIVDVNYELKPHQIIIEIDDKNSWSKVRESIIQFIIGLNKPNIQILESSHSMDIIDQTVTNKLNIVSKCVDLASLSNLSKECLCIGDKGKWPGNDYQLLSFPYSLSVDEISAVDDSCWNLAKSGIKNIEATIYYLSCLNFNNNGLILSIT